MDETLLRDLVNQLRELVPTLRALGPSSTGKGDPVEKASVAFDRSSSRIVTAIGKLAAQLDKNTRGKKAEERSLAQFVKEVDRAADAQEKAAQEVADFASEIDAAGQSVRQSQQESAKVATKSAKDIARERYNEYQKEQALLTNYAAMQARDMLAVSDRQNTLAGTLERLGDTTAESQLRMLKLGRFIEDAGKALGELGNIGKSAANTLADLGTNGFNSFSQLNGVVDSVTGAISKMGSSIPFLGAAMTALAETTKFALTQIQQVADNFRELSEVGALTADGMSGLRQNLLDSGLTQQGLTNIIKQNSTAFSMLGGTVGDGTVKFSKFVGKLTKDTTGAGMQLRQLGLSADDIGESAAAFVALQGRLGTTQRMTQTQLTDGTVRYARELDIISKITGQTRKELQASQQKALDEQRFRAKIEQMRRNGEGAAAEQALNLSAALEKTAPGFAKGFRDIFAAGGSAVTEEARQVLGATDGAIVGIVQQLARGGDIGDALGQLQTSIGKSTDRLNTTAQFADVSSYLGDYAQLLDITKLSAGDLKTAIASAKETQDKQAAGQDAFTTKVVEAQQQLELAAKAVQDFGFDLALVAAPAVAKFSEVLKDIAGEVNDRIGTPLQTSTSSMFQEGAGLAAGTAGAIGGAKAGMALGTMLLPGVGTAIGGLGGMVAGGLAGYFGGKSAAASAGLGTVTRPTGPSGAESTSGAPTMGRASDVLQFTERTGSAGAFAGLDTRLQQAVLAAATEYNSATGNKLIINSAKRSSEDQKRLWDETVAAGREGIGPTGMAVAAPGKSPHELGHAVDIQNYKDTAAVAAMNRQGLLQKVKGDPVHFSFDKGGIASGPKSGYKAMLHGTEAVVPLPDGRKIPVSMQDSTGGNLTKQMDMMSAQLMRLDEMVSLMRRQVGVSDKMLRVSQS